MKIHLSSHGCEDSGCTVHCSGEKVLVTNKTPVLRGIRVVQPDATTMRSSQIDLLPISQLSIAARPIHILPDMKDQCLMSAGQLCDDGSAINFDATYVYLRKGDLQLRGTRDPISGLYCIEFYAPTPPPQVMNPSELTIYPLAAKSEARDYFAHHMTTKSYLVQ